MARFVIEPVVAVKWFVPEEHSGPAARLLDGGNQLLAPDILLVEAGRLIAAKVRLEELSVEEGTHILESLRSVPLVLQPSVPFLEPSLRIAGSLDISFVEGLGLSVAVQSDCRLVTANRRLSERVRGTPFAAHAKWVGDLR